jgi:hypothetical protein
VAQKTKKLPQIRGSFNPIKQTKPMRASVKSAVILYSHESVLQNGNKQNWQTR